MLAGIFSSGKSGTTLLLKLVDKFSKYYPAERRILQIKFLVRNNSRIKKCLYLNEIKRKIH